MTYTPQTWADGEAGGTPISAARLVHMETGIDDADTRLTAVEGDSRWTNSRNPNGHAASHASGGTDPVTPAAIGAANTSHTHAAADPYPLSGYGFFAASDRVPSFTVISTIGTFYTRIFVPAGNTITYVASVVSATGTLGAGGLNGFAVFDDTGTLLQSTATDNNLWTTAGWRVKALSSPIASQGSDRYVIAGITCNGYSALATIPYCVTGPGTGIGLSGGNGVTNRRSYFSGGLSSWANINPATEGTTTNYLPLIALG